MVVSRRRSGCEGRRKGRGKGRERFRRERTREVLMVVVWWWWRRGSGVVGVLIDPVGLEGKD